MIVMNLDLHHSCVECVKNCDVLMHKLIALHAAGMKNQDQER